MISVCMTTFNGEHFIKEQIDSILVQLKESDELIISDDGSTDKTLSIIAQYNDSRIKLFHHQKNTKLSKKKFSRNFYYATENFENAIKNAKGEYIFLTDQDDIWLPNKVTKMIEVLKQSDCALCNCIVIDSKGNELHNFWNKQPFQKCVFRNMGRSPFLGCCMAFTRSALSYLLPFPRKLVCHDLWIGCLCAHRKQLMYISEPLHKYRLHENNVSPSATLQSKNPLWYRLWYRLCFIKQFLVRVCISR